ncbi:hypothetical protein [Streptomyces sp. NPDC047043]
MMHPYRQIMCMQAMRCQVCQQPARTPLGYLFLAGPADHDPMQPTMLTNQPPVCVKHARAATRLCPHLAGRPMVFLATGFPLYGVHGTLYGLGTDGVKVIDQPEAPLPFRHPNLPTFLASQLVRKLTSFRVVDLDEALQQLTVFSAQSPAR